MTSPKSERRLGHISHTTVTGGVSTADMSAKNAGHEIMRTGSGQTV